MGGIFEKSLARSPFRYAPPRPRTPAPAPQRGGWGPPENSGTEIYTTITSSPVPMVRPSLFR
nr:MAG TPA: hypothetical protein [Ackermannviridae sp.]